MTIAKNLYDDVKKHKLCFGCLGKAYSIKECLVSPRRIDGCDKKHNQFLIENRSGRKPIHLNQPTMKVHLTNPRTGKLIETCALQDTGSTVTLKDKSFKGC